MLMRSDYHASLLFALPYHRCSVPSYITFHPSLHIDVKVVLTFTLLLAFLCAQRRGNAPCLQALSFQYSQLQVLKPLHISPTLRSTPRLITLRVSLVTALQSLPYSYTHARSLLYDTLTLTRILACSILPGCYHLNSKG